MLSMGMKAPPFLFSFFCKKRIFDLRAFRKRVASIIKDTILKWELCNNLEKM